MQRNNQKTESNIKHYEMEHFWGFKSNNYETARFWSFEKKKNNICYEEKVFFSYKTKIMSLLRILAKKTTSSTLKLVSAIFHYF